MAIYDSQGQGLLLTFVQGHSDSTFSNFFTSETARRAEAKFHMGPPWDVGNEICSNDLADLW